MQKIQCLAELILQETADIRMLLLAGLLTVRNLADCVISMDADLQDDINAIDEMLEKFENDGCDVVYGVRDNRETDTIFKRRTAGAFYKLMQGLGSQSVPNHADFRLMSRRALEGLAQFPEQNLFCEAWFL